MRVDKISGGYINGFSLNDISFTIDEGKMYGLLGLNGSGKTTIIKMICGLLEVESGNIFVEDKDILALNEKERAKFISYVPQYSDIKYDTSVIDVVLMGITPYLKMFQTPSSKHIRRAYICLEELGIDDLTNTNYQILSGGQKQLVIIARALLQNGRYMLLDEPDSSLDLINKNHLMKKIREITDIYNKGSLISMHNPEYALNYCDNIILVKDGKISEINLRKESTNLVKRKLSEVYGDVDIIKYKDRFILYYK